MIVAEAIATIDKENTEANAFQIQWRSFMQTCSCKTYVYTCILDRKYPECFFLSNYSLMLALMYDCHHQCHQQTVKL